MKSSIPGRVRNFEQEFKGSPLIAVLEAVVNSIQATPDERGGEIIVRINYGTDQANLDGSSFVPGNQTTKQTINSFEIIDHGAGFNEDNYDSFDTLDSEYKLDLGCKGIGRLTWLVVFNNVHVDSHYSSETGMKHISFDFDRVNGIRNTECGPSEYDTPITTIKLYSVRENFRKGTSTNVDRLADIVLDHCISYYIQGVKPDITITDSSGVHVSLRQLYCERNYNVKTEELTVRGQQFTVNHLLKEECKSKSVAKLSYCANSREVISESILKDVKLVDGNNQYYSYTAYVSGELLNQSVTSDRSGFNIPENIDITDPDVVSMAEIKDVLITNSLSFLSPILNEYRIECEKHLEEFISNNQEFDYVRKNYPKIIDEITPDMSESELYSVMNKGYAILESNYVFDVKKVLNQSLDWGSDDERTEIFEKMSEAQHAALAKYMSHRKYIINILEKSLNSYWSESDGKEKYVKENIIHDIFMPRHLNNHKLTLDNCNLWLLDDRLNYYSFTSSHSDTCLKSFTDSDKDDRPDVCIFSDKRNGVISAVTIIEFKRPERTDMDVLKQIMYYINELKDHTISDYNGRTVKIADGAIFHCYILCDIDENSLGKLLENMDFFRLYDGRSYYRWYSNLKAHIEVIDFDHLLKDVKIRNKIFFQILDETESVKKTD